MGFTFLHGLCRSQMEESKSYTWMCRTSASAMVISTQNAANCSHDHAAISVAWLVHLIDHCALQSLHC